MDFKKTIFRDNKKKLKILTGTVPEKPYQMVCLAKFYFLFCDSKPQALHIAKTRLRQKSWSTQQYNYSQSVSEKQQKLSLISKPYEVER